MADARRLASEAAAGVSSAGFRPFFAAAGSSTAKAGFSSAKAGPSSADSGPPSAEAAAGRETRRPHTQAQRSRAARTAVESDGAEADRRFQI